MQNLHSWGCPRSSRWRPRCNATFKTVVKVGGVDVVIQRQIVIPSWGAVLVIEIAYIHFRILATEVCERVIHAFTRDRVFNRIIAGYIWLCHLKATERPILRIEQRKSIVRSWMANIIHIHRVVAICTKVLLEKPNTRTKGGLQLIKKVLRYRIVGN